MRDKKPMPGSTGNRDSKLYNKRENPDFSARVDIWGKKECSEEKTGRFGGQPVVSALGTHFLVRM